MEVLFVNYVDVLRATYIYNIAVVIISSVRLIITPHLI